MLTTTPKNPKLLAQHQAYVERAKNNGAKFLTYICPRCDSELETRAPDHEDDVWDTLCTCPYCDRMHFKITRYAAVEAIVPPAESGL